MSNTISSTELQAVFRSVAKEITGRRKSFLKRSRNDAACFIGRTSLGESIALAYRRVSEANLPKEQQLRLLVRIALVWEFGNELLDDPGFLELSEKVLVNLQKDDKLVAKMYQELLVEF